MNSFTCSCILAVAFFVGGCSKSPEPTGNNNTASPPQQTETYTVQGILRGINFAEGSVTVEHEEIPDYMPAMTMPFDVKAMSEVEPLKAGDAIEFKMVVTDKESWIERVKKISASEIQLPAKRNEVASGSPEATVERVKEGDPIPPFQLVDSKGRQITQASFADKPLLLTFIFTRCPIPNFCPLMSNNFRDIQKGISDDPQLSASVQYLSVSFDPEFDTPQVLDEYAARYTQDRDIWRFATGSSEEIKRLTKAFSVYIQPESGTISHGLVTVLVGPDGIVRKIWRGNSWKPEEAVVALREFASLKAAPAAAR
jgi:protein SCO1